MRSNPDFHRDIVALIETIRGILDATPVLPLAERDPSAWVGRRIAERYHVERLLGQGGMGAVFLAHDARLRRRVAIKMLLPEVAADAQQVARFSREALAVGKLDHPNVVRVTDFDRLPDGTWFMVLEYLEGRDLDAVLEATPTPPWRQLVEWIREACRGLHAAHEAGYVHRDLKPANVFITSADSTMAPLRGDAKVLDFGISKVLEGSAADAPDMPKPKTKTGMVFGSIHYMAPEQLEGRGDRRIDVWALGVILYQGLAGARPFDGESQRRCAHAILTTSPRPLRALRPDLPPSLCEVVDACLVKDPQHRLPSCSELEQRLAAIEDASRERETVGAVLAPSGPSILPRVVAAVGTALGAALVLIAAAFAARWVSTRFVERPLDRAEPNAADRDDAEWARIAGSEADALPPYSILRTPVRGRDYRACVGAAICTRPRDGTGCTYADASTRDRPVTCVTWVQADAYCRWRGARLPTRAESEWAASETDRTSIEGEWVEDRALDASGGLSTQRTIVRRGGSEASGAARSGADGEGGPAELTSAGGGGAQPPPEERAEDRADPDAFRPDLGFRCAR